MSCSGSVDPETGEQVPYGQLGQVVMNHISKACSYRTISNVTWRSGCLDPQGNSAIRSARCVRWPPRGRGRHRGRVLIVRANRQASHDSSVYRRARPQGEYRTRNREVIISTAGVPVAELSLGATAVCVENHLPRNAKIKPLPVPAREAALVNAAHDFATAVIGGLDFDAYVELASKISGLPISVTRAGARGVVDAVANAFDAVRPARRWVRRSIGERNALAMAAQCGPVAEKCSPCMRRERPRRTRSLAPGARAGLSGGRCARRAASR